MTVISGVGGAGTWSSASGGKLYAFNALDDTTPVVVAPVNTQRQKITFHNPGDVDVLVYPVYKQNTGSDAANLPTPAARGGAFLVFGSGGTLEITGECQKSWAALAVSGSGKPLTVLDTNIS